VSSAPRRRRLAERAPRGRARLRLALVLLAVGVAAWAVRAPLLRAVGHALVAEDPVAPVDVVAVSHANVRASALEAAALYRDGVARRFVVAEWERDDLKAMLDELGVPHPASHELAVAILAKSGVPRDAITVLPGGVDGTNPEITAVVRFAQRERPASLLYVTSRSHTARAAERLRREAPGTRILVRASRWDDFDPDRWWHRRGSTREVWTEYLRWFNSYVLGDRWRARTARPEPAAAPQGASTQPVAGSARPSSIVR
jgi:uncharacterized SAM-binding protein YcdF (DUF218 family)